MIATSSKCQHIKSDGEPCRAARLKDSDYCYFHSPKTGEQFKESSGKGGEARHGRKLDIEPMPAIDLTSRLGALDALQNLANEVAQLEPSHRKAQTIVSIIQAAMPFLEHAEQVHAVFDPEKSRAQMEKDKLQADLWLEIHGGGKSERRKSIEMTSLERWRDEGLTVDADADDVYEDYARALLHGDDLNDA